MNVNCYLPDDLGARAKAAEIPLSAIFKDAVVRELERVEREAEGSKIPGLEGAYVRGRASKRPSIQIHLNAASEAKGNGINLAPSERVPEPESGRRSLMLTESAVRKLYAAIEGGE